MTTTEIVNSEESAQIHAVANGHHLADDGHCIECRSITETGNLSLEEKIDAIFRFTQQFGALMEQVMPMVSKLAEHPMISTFMGG